MRLLSFLDRLFVLGAMLSALACSGGADDRPPMGDFDYTEDNVPPEEATDAAADRESAPEEPVCLDGETQKCSVYLPTQNGVVNCFRGVQICENGQWGECGDLTEKKTDAEDESDGPQDSQ
jgi:hypothetical protein